MPEPTPFNAPVEAAEPDTEAKQEGEEEDE